MSDTETTETHTVKAVIEGDAKVSLGERAQAAIRFEASVGLSAAAERLEAAFEAIVEDGGQEKRGDLEDVIAAAAEVQEYANVLWWLGADA